MTRKIRDILLMSLTALLIVSLFAVTFTYGRYNKTAESENADFPSEISYTVTNKIEVTTVDELLSAIGNGYTYVKLSEEMVNPLVMTMAVTDLGTDLIIDLNGHELQRNSRDPMLNIKPGVTLTIIDSSADGNGSLYNPVGSVLQIGGGTLTVSAGHFESGPRKAEYFKRSSSGGTTESGGTITAKEIDVTFFEKTSTGYSEGVKINLPEITPYVYSRSNGNYYINGNIYFKENEGYTLYANSDNALSDSLTLGDAYLYYSLDDSTVQTADIFAANSSADFYFYYNVVKSTDGEGEPSYSYTPREADGETVFTVTVYGYYKVIETAKNAGENSASASGAALTDKFAAVKMESGRLYVRGGSYDTYFGVDSAFCVYSKGGYFVIDDGSFSAIEDGVCIRNSYSSDSSDDSLLSVTGGTFYSELGDTIQVVNGKMTVTGGTFYKDASANSNDNSVLDASLRTSDLANNAAISISSDDSGLTSSLTVTGEEDAPVEFYLKGSGINGIECYDGASITVTDTLIETQKFGYTIPEYSYNGTDYSSKEVSDTYGINNLGIYNTGGNVNVCDSSFNLYSDTSAGIVSAAAGGDVYTENCVFGMSGYNSKGIYSLGGKVTVPNGVFSMTGQAAVGILASAGEVNVGLASNKSGAYEASSFDNTVNFYIDHVRSCYGVWADVNDSENNSLDKDEDGNDITNKSAAVKINLYSAKFFLGQGKLETPETVDGNEITYYYETEIESTYDESVSRGNGDIFCAGIYSNLENAEINVGRGVFLLAGSYSAGIYALKGKIQTLDGVLVSDENGDTTATNKAAIFVGMQYELYSNGGTSNTTGGWIDISISEKAFVQNLYLPNLNSTPAYGSYGIASFGGAIDLNSVYVQLRSVRGSGIFSYSSESDGGDVKISHYEAYILDQLSETTEKIEVDTDGDGIAEETGNYLSTSAMTVVGGTVEIGAANVFSTGIGVVVVGGSLLFNGGTVPLYNVELAKSGTDGWGNLQYSETLSKLSPQNVIIEAARTTAIYVSKQEGQSSATDCEVTFGKDTVVSIKSTLFDFGDKIERVYDGVEGASRISAYKVTAEGDTGLSIPWSVSKTTATKDENGETIVKTEPDTPEFRYDGILVSGGSFKSSGVLEMTFKGLKNDTSYLSATGARMFGALIKSFAVNVSGGNFEAVGELGIETTVGGGVKVSGGNATIGNADSDGDDVTISTKGAEYGSNGTADTGTGTGGYIYYYYPTSYVTDNWKAPINLTGGHALEVNGGSLTVYNGTFEAALGNGVYVSSTATDAENYPQVTLYDGTYAGNVPSDWVSAVFSSGGKATGPGAYYGVEIMGGSDTNIYGGTYSGGNGGVFVSGFNATKSVGGTGGVAYNLTSFGTANMYIYAGIFNGDNDGFNVYDASNVVFGAYEKGKAPEDFDYFNAIQINQGSGFGLCMNPFNENNIYVMPTVAVYYGTYTGHVYDYYGTINTYNYEDGDSPHCLSISLSYTSPTLAYDSALGQLFYPSTSYS